MGGGVFVAFVNLSFYGMIMRHTNSHLGLVLMLFAFAFFASSTAWAQAQTKFQVEHFEPLPSQGINTLNVGKADVLGHLKPSAGLFFNYMKEPLVIAPVGGSVDDAGGGRLIDNQLKAELLASLGLFDLASIGVAVPVVLYQNGDQLTQLGSNASVSSLVLGDIRLVPKVIVLDPKKEWTKGFGVGILLPLYLPVGDDLFQSDGTVRIEPRLALSWMHKSGFNVSGNVGFQLLRNDEEARNFKPGNTLRYALGMEVPVGWDKMRIVGSFFGNYGLNDAANIGNGNLDDVDKDSPMEVDLGAQFYLPANLIANVGAGTGLNDSIGSPRLRVFASINYTPLGEPEDPDRDKDGILNEQDKCPDKPEDKDNFQDDDGCPDPDNDQDTVLDENDKCPDKKEDLDNYADKDGCPDPDNDNDGILDEKDKCPLKPEDKDNFEDADGCPDPDNDKDGIADKKDLCPNSPEDKDGFEDENGCPDPDNDSDGVLDKDDKCPMVPGVISEKGCPIKDQDKDGIPDDKDKCPTKPETFNGIKDADGCPDGKASAKIEKGRIVILKKVFFATNKDKILKKSFPVLSAVAGILRANPQVTEIRIEGHTDDVGKDADNLDLSKRRAKSVKKFLVDKEKIDGKRLIDEGYGETKPLCKDVSALSKTKKLKRRNRKKIKACRATNRRVEFLVTGVNGKRVTTTKIKTQ